MLLTNEKEFPIWLRLFNAIGNEVWVPYCSIAAKESDFDCSDADVTCLAVHSELQGLITLFARCEPRSASIAHLQVLGMASICQQQGQKVTMNLCRSRQIVDEKQFPCSAFLRDLVHIAQLTCSGVAVLPGRDYLVLTSLRFAGYVFGLLAPFQVLVFRDEAEMICHIQNENTARSLTPGRGVPWPDKGDSCASKLLMRHLKKILSSSESLAEVLAKCGCLVDDEGRISLINPGVEPQNQVSKGEEGGIILQVQAKTSSGAYQNSVSGGLFTVKSADSPHICPPCEKSTLDLIAEEEEED